VKLVPQIWGLVFILGTVPAAGQVTATAGGSPDRIIVAIPVTASIAVRCAFAANAAPSGTYATPDLNVGFTHDFLFALQCNAPSRVAVVSANGGLLAPLGVPPPGYTFLAPYRVTLALVGDAGVPAVNAECGAQALTAAAAFSCPFRGPASTSQGLKLAGSSSGASGSYLRVSAPVYTGAEILVASPAYDDTLTVTLSTAQ
jgi:hypothetical protein